MKTSIFDRLKMAGQVVAGTLRPDEMVAIKGYWDIEHHVAQPGGGWKVNRYTRENVVTAAGMNRIANRAVNMTVNSWFNYLVIGTQTSAPADTDTQANVGEVTNGRKIAAVNIQSREWISLTSTWAGNADGLTGIALDSAAISDYVNSSASTGLIANRVNGMAVTLAASDFLNLTVRIRVGSHNQAHTT